MILTKIVRAEIVKGSVNVIRQDDLRSRELL